MTPGRYKQLFSHELAHCVPVSFSEGWVAKMPVKQN